MARAFFTGPLLWRTFICFIAVFGLYNGLRFDLINLFQSKWPIYARMNEPSTWLVLLVGLCWLGIGYWLLSTALKEVGWIGRLIILAIIGVVAGWLYTMGWLNYRSALFYQISAFLVLVFVLWIPQIRRYLSGAVTTVGQTDDSHHGHHPAGHQ